MKAGGGRMGTPQASLAALLIAASSAGWAAHPFITDDAGTQGAGKWQLELAAQRDRHRALGDAGAGPVQQRTGAGLLTAVLTHGVHDDVDLALGLNHLRLRTQVDGAAAERASGSADSTLELKWRFYDREGMSLALKPGVTVPSGDENRGLGTGRASWSVILIADYEAAPWVWLANVAYAHARYRLPQDAADSRTDLWRVSAGAEYIVRRNLRLVGETGVRTNAARADPFLPGRHARFAMLGMIYSPRETVDFDLGVRRGLNRAETRTVLLAGATMRW